MDYEKAYKEALERAKAGKPMDEVFPELKESKDERIMNEIIFLLKHYNSEEELTTQDTIESMIAYLEKKKKPHYTKRNALFDRCVENCDPVVMKNVSDEVDEMLQKEQKPAEWNFDNRIQYDNIKSGIEAFSKTYSFNIESQLTPSLSEEQMKIWRKEIEQAVIAGGEMGIELKNDDRYEENKMPAEWSEKDEAMLKVAIAVLRRYSHDDVANWLKSLRPQPNTVSIKDATKFGNLEYERGVKDGIQSEKSRHWKPSEEQMRAVFDASERNDKLGSILRNLYSELKKL